MINQAKNQNIKTDVYVGEKNELFKTNITKVKKSTADISAIMTAALFKSSQNIGEMKAED